MAATARSRLSREQLLVQLDRVVTRADALLDSAAEADTPPYTPVDTDAFDALVLELEVLKRAHLTW